MFDNKKYLFGIIEFMILVKDKKVLKENGREKWEIIRIRTHPNQNCNTVERRREEGWKNIEKYSAVYGNYQQKTTLKIGGNLGKTACIFGGRVV